MPERATDELLNGYLGLPTGTRAVVNPPPDILMLYNYEYKTGESCNHHGCLNHVSKPCEGCGRIAGKTL